MRGAILVVVSILNKTTCVGVRMSANWCGGEGEGGVRGGGASGGWM